MRKFVPLAASVALLLGSIFGGDAITYWP